VETIERLTGPVTEPVRGESGDRRAGVSRLPERVLRRRHGQHRDEEDDVGAQYHAAASRLFGISRQLYCRRRRSR
jgi:hypothetical protein